MHKFFKHFTKYGQIRYRAIVRAYQLRFVLMYWVYESYFEVIWKNTLINWITEKCSYMSFADSAAAIFIILGQSTF